MPDVGDPFAALMMNHRLVGGASLQIGFVQPDTVHTRAFPLALSAGMAAGTGFTYPLYCWFSEESLDAWAAISFGPTVFFGAVAIAALVWRRRLYRASRATRWLLVGAVWVTIAIFWAVWSNLVV